MSGRLKFKSFATSAPSASTPPARDSPLSSSTAKNAPPSSSSLKRKVSPARDSPMSSSRAKNAPPSSSSLKRKVSPAAPPLLASKLLNEPSRREALERSIKEKGKVLHRWNNLGFFYEATISKILQPKNGEVQYLLHYSGWGKGYDTKLTKEEILETCRLWTKEDAELANKEVKEAQKKTYGTGNKSPTRKSVRAPADRESSPISASKKPETPTPTSPAASVKVAEDPADGIQIPSKLEKMSNLEYVFPPKVTIEKAFAKYAKKLNKKGISPCPPHTVEMVVNTLLTCIQDEWDEYLPVLLTPKEFTEYFNILNAKRASLDQPPIDAKDYRDTSSISRQGDNSKRNSFREIMLPMADSFDVVYFIRFVKIFNERLNAKSFMKIFYEPLFNDILRYLDGYINAETYDDLD